MAQPTKPILRYSLAQAMEKRTNASAAKSKAFSLADAMRRLTEVDVNKDGSR